MATFESIGLYWQPDAELAVPADGCGVEYREPDSSWKPGFKLWYDAVEKECRGSLVQLRPGRRYELRLSAVGSAPATIEASTWSEAFPVARTINLPEYSSVPLVVDQSGSAETGYVVYEPAAGRSATIDVGRAHDFAVTIDAHHVILRGLVLRGARKSAILLGRDSGVTADEARLLLDPDYVLPDDPEISDIVIEHNDVSQWGSNGLRDPRFGGNLQSAILSTSSRARRLIVQRNRLHHPYADSNSWDEYNKNLGGEHPNGPQAITVLNSLGNHVIRYNEIYSDNEHRFNDGMGQLDNFTERGFPSRDSDIYGNYISHTWDDGIEAEGGNRNVRIWGNYFTQNYHPMAIAPTTGGPLYIWRNLSHVSLTSDRRPGGQDFVKARPYGKHRNWSGGAVYLFNNTPLRPRFEGESTSNFLREIDNDNRIHEFNTRNNLMQVFDPETDYSLRIKYGRNTSFDYDLYDGRFETSPRQGETEIHGIRGTAELQPDWGLDEYRMIGSFSLVPGSPGQDQGLAIPNFTDGFVGAAPDMGAHEAGTPPMEFGVHAASSGFVPVNGVPAAGLQTSNLLRLGLPAGVHTLAVNGGESSVNGSEFSASDRTVSDGDTVRVRHLSASAPSTARRTRVFIGDRRLDFITTTFGTDAEPDPFSFTDRDLVPVYSLIASEFIVLSGLDAAAEVSVTGGEYSINGSPYTTRTTPARNGDRLQLRHRSSEDFLSVTETRVVVGGSVSATFRSRTYGPENADAEPDPFAFATLNDALLNRTVYSNPVELTGFNRPLDVSIRGGLYSLNAQPFTDLPTVVRSYDRLRLSHVTPATGETETVTTLTVGGIEKTFRSITGKLDAEPDPFAYPPVLDAPLNTVVKSRSVEPQGFNVAVPIRVYGGEYCINALPCTTEPGTLRYSDNVVLRHISATEPGTETVTTVVVGSQIATFTSRTLEADDTPDPFAFTALTDVAPATDYDSDIVTIGGINLPVSITIRNGAYSINGGPFGSAPGTLAPGDRLQLRCHSADTAGTQSASSVTVGSFTTGFAITTRPPDTTPEPFGFGQIDDAAPKTRYTSRNITVQGIDAPAPISISTGSYYSINGARFTSAPATIRAGDRVRVRHISSAKAGAVRTTMLNIGGLSGSFVTVTRTATP